MLRIGIEASLYNAFSCLLIKLINMLMIENFGFAQFAVDS